MADYDDYGPRRETDPGSAASEDSYTPSAPSPAPDNTASESPRLAATTWVTTHAPADKPAPLQHTYARLDSDSLIADTSATTIAAISASVPLPPPTTSAVSTTFHNIQPTPTPDRQLRWWSTAVLALASGVIGATAVLAGMFAAGAFDESADQAAVQDVGSPVTVGLEVVPSIVTIEIGTGATVQDFQVLGSGSGVVYTEEGLIITNHHVVEQSEVTQVTFQNGRIYQAELLGSDPLTDLAVLSINASDLQPIEFGSTLQLRIGDPAIAIGSPLGLSGGASLTAGVVSAFDRQIRVSDTSTLHGMLQTDAPITNGSSGGALVDRDGSLIGITTAIGVSVSGAEGVGFATPVETVKRIIDQIVESGQVSHPFLGVILTPRFETQEDGSSLPAGAAIHEYSRDSEGRSAVAEAGVEIGDVIVSWNDNPVTTLQTLINGVRTVAVGDTITLAVERGQETHTFEVLVGERPEGV